MISRVCKPTTIWLTTVYTTLYRCCLITSQNRNRQATSDRSVNTEIVLPTTRPHNAQRPTPTIPPSTRPTVRIITVFFHTLPISFHLLPWLTYFLVLYITIHYFTLYTDSASLILSTFHGPAVRSYLYSSIPFPSTLALTYGMPQ